MGNTVIDLAKLPNSPRGNGPEKHRRTGSRFGLPACWNCFMANRTSSKSMSLWTARGGQKGSRLSSASPDSTRKFASPFDANFQMAIDECLPPNLSRPVWSSVSSPSSGCAPRFIPSTHLLLTRFGVVLLGVRQDAPLPLALVEGQYLERRAQSVATKSRTAATRRRGEFRQVDKPIPAKVQRSIQPTQARSVLAIRSPK